MLEGSDIASKAFIEQARFEQGASAANYAERPYLANQKHSGYLEAKGVATPQGCLESLFLVCYLGFSRGI